MFYIVFVIQLLLGITFMSAKIVIGKVILGDMNFLHEYSKHSHDILQTSTAFKEYQIFTYRKEYLSADYMKNGGQNSKDKIIIMLSFFTKHPHSTQCQISLYIYIFFLCLTL